MVSAIGGAATDLDYFYGHLLCREAFTNDLLWPYPVLDDIAAASIVVAESGRRFADEGGGGIFLANTVARRENPLSAVVVFDSKIWDGPGRAGRIPANPQLERSGATIFRGNTMGELVAAARLPCAALADSVMEYNSALHSGSLAKLAPRRTTTSYAAMPIEVSPLYVIQACAGITYTMGGIRINGEGRVAGRNGRSIEGFYAAGTTTGGLEGGERVHYVGGLSRAGVFGMKAAEHIARSVGLSEARADS